MSPLKMTQQEYDKLNPPFRLGDMSSSVKWQYVGHIPAPRTKMGWFVYDIIHGLAMRYRLLPVLAFALGNLRRERIPGELSLTMADDDSIWADYDETSCALTIYFNGKPSPCYVNWINDRVGTLHNDETHAIVGIKIDKYKLGKPVVIEGRQNDLRSMEMQ